MLVQEEWNKSLARPSTFVKRQHQESLFLMWSTFKAILWWLNPWRAWDVHTCGVLSCRPLRILASTWQTLGRVFSVLLNAQWKCHEEMLSHRHYLDSNAFKVSRCQASHVAFLKGLRLERKTDGREVILCLTRTHEDEAINVLPCKTGRSKWQAPIFVSVQNVFWLAVTNACCANKGCLSLDSGQSKDTEREGES